MSKIICDVCGTSYSDTSTQCPICGSVHQGDLLNAGQSSQDVGGYTYVKGGRFSKTNVKKRSSGAGAKPQKAGHSGKNSKGLIIVLALLAVIFIAMVIFIFFGFLNNNPDGSGDSLQNTEPSYVACEKISVSQPEIQFETIGDSFLISVSSSPANTTEVVRYSVDNPDVATVSENGLVVCVGDGTAVITITCGDQTTTCQVVCVLPTEGEQLPTVAPEGVVLNRISILADFQGYQWILYNGKIPMSEIHWKSDNPNVATVVDGLVEAVGEGETMIHADYNGIRTSCTIICDFDPDEDDVNGEQPATLGGELTLYSQYGELTFNEHIQAYDVMISVGESVALRLKDSNGTQAQVTWVIVNGTSCEIDGEYVTALNSLNDCMVEAEYNGVIYSCLVRTKN